MSVEKPTVVQEYERVSCIKRVTVENYIHLEFYRKVIIIWFYS